MLHPSPGIADHPVRVLIVDDERRNRELLEVMLAVEGYQLLAAESGEETLALVARDPPDLILLDVMMPGMDGYQVAGKIKGDLTTRNIPIIMITVLDDRNARMLGLSAGVEDFLTKPVDRAELCVRVRNLLRLKAYGDYHDRYSQLLESEVGSRTADLHQERSRAQRYLDTAQVILLALDSEGRITLANRFACSLLGWTEGELLGRDWFDTCIAAGNRDHVRARFGSLIGADGSVSENTIVTRSGEERLVEWRTTVMREETGQVTGTLSSGTDVTERTKAVGALRAAEERMRFALESANVGIWDMDYASKTVRWSKTLESQYGLEPGAFAGTFDAFMERIHPDDRESVLMTVGRAMKAGTDFTIQNRTITPDGKVRSMTGAGRFILDERGAPVRGVGISQDVTERRTLERQYQQAQKMEAIGQLASGVAHDFNNLLTVILGCAEIVIADGTVTAEHGEDLGEIIKAARRAAGLTKQLLAFGRQQVLLAAPLDVNELITNMAGMLRRLIGEDIAVALTLAPNVSLALADRGQLEQVVMNLVVNARDAMPNGGTVTIESGNVELENNSLHEQAVTPGQYVMLAITDTGSGMSKETQRRLFEPFFTTKEPGRGTGLGLATTYGIVKQSKGYVWVYSEIGRGTTFKVYLPRAASDITMASIPARVSGPTKRPSETVLLVEDEAGVRRLSKRILERIGYRVLEAGTGEEAEAIFVGHVGSIDLVVTDVVMPGGGGPELLQRLQIHTPGLKVLYMSGYTEQSAVLKAGIDRGVPFLQKPFTAADFVRHVRDALDR